MHALHAWARSQNARPTTTQVQCGEGSSYQSTHSTRGRWQPTHPAARRIGAIAATPALSSNGGSSVEPGRRASPPAPPPPPKGDKGHPPSPFPHSCFGGDPLAAQVGGARLPPPLTTSTPTPRTVRMVSTMASGSTARPQPIRVHVGGREQRAGAQAAPPTSRRRHFGLVSYAVRQEEPGVFVALVRAPKEASHTKQWWSDGWGQRWARVHCSQRRTAPGAAGAFEASTILRKAKFPRVALCQGSCCPSPLRADARMWEGPRGFAHESSCLPPPPPPLLLAGFRTAVCNQTCV